jgi:hypothetical protein
MKRLSLGVVLLVSSMACSGSSSPVSPTPVATPPPAPSAPVARIIGLSISSTRDVVTVNQTSVFNATALFDDGSIMPITPEWESTTEDVTLLANGPVAFVTGQRVGGAFIRARAAGLVAVRGLQVHPQR